MCGIAGFLAPPGVRADRAMLERMVRTLAHRGPDTFGFHVDGPAALGIARLRVIDLVTGDQPIGNEDGAVPVALTGELYGFAALRAVLAHPHVGRALDPEGLARYLAYDFVPNPHTIVRGVRKLPPGHALSAGDGKVRVERYWELPSRPDEGDEPTWRREIVRRL